MEDRLCFVQFIHPGGEHEPDNGEVKAWNRGAHRRKFLLGSGIYVDGEQSQEGEVVFWGEWEPESRVVARFAQHVPDGPHHLYEPFYKVPAEYRGLQNTDPFVFGKQFHYTGCLQHAAGRPTQMRNLARGSVVLFGSCLRRSVFVLDTVLVVDRFIDHAQVDWRTAVADQVAATYRDVTVEPWYANTDLPYRSHRLYFGATWEQPCDGMYSFFPCLPRHVAPQGFARPVIRIPEAVTDTLNQGKRLNPQASIADCRRLWEAVVSQVLGQGLCLGVRAALPVGLSRSDGVVDRNNTTEREDQLPRVRC